MTKKIFITWEDFHKNSKELCEKIKNTGEYNKIIAISRGGLIPAGILAYELNIRNSQAINISSYDENKQRDEQDIEVSSQVSDVDEKTLIVDDLSDTGKTFRILRTLYPRAKYVAVYAKPEGRKMVDIYAKDMPNDWIVFPWDL